MHQPDLGKIVRAGRGLRLEVAAVGIVLVVLTAALDATGNLAFLENILGDLRTRYFQHGKPDDKNRLLHLDLDDGSLTAVGRWPWPRQTQADILDELGRAKPKAVALDITLSDVESKEQLYLKSDDGRFTALMGDQALAATIARLRNVTLAAAVRNYDTTPTRQELALLDILRADPGLSRDQAVDALRGRQFSDEVSVREVADDYPRLQREAVGFRVNELLAADPRRTLADVKTALGVDPMLQTPLAHLIDDAYTLVQSVTELRRFCLDLPAGLRYVLSRPVYQAPLPPFVRAADGAGAVTYLPDAFADGRIRSVPLFVKLGGRLLPELGFALACKELDADPAKIEVARDAVRVPLAGGDVITVPVSTRRLANGSTVGLMFDIPWFGGSDWATMYDPARRKPLQHLSIVELWDAITAERQIATNLAQADDAVALLMEVAAQNDPRPEVAARRDKFVAAAKADPADWPLRQEAIDQLVAELKDAFEGVKPTTDEDARLANSFNAVRHIREQVPLLRKQLADKRDKIAAAVAGKAVMIGWTATGVAADFVPTPLHPTCPGVVIHGAVFNAMMTRAFVRPAPFGAALAATIFAGLITTAAVAWLTPVRAFAAAAAAGIGYALFDALYMYKLNGVAVGLAGPTTAGLAVWASCTLLRFVIERSEREKLKRRFQSYVDPKIVQYVLENPHQARLAGQQCEMTVVFTDLAGFTTVSERLGERTVELLNEYFGVMVPIIRANRGILNKFLGDGMMFYFNAPVAPNDDHARDAVSAVLQMQHALDAFNKALHDRGLPPVKMRAGITTGSMIAGDAGSADARAFDYTVLGDNVNLAARLESANKASGTLTLCSEQTVRLLGDGFLTRPVGRLQVVGKTEWVMTHEIMCHDSEATPEQRQIAQITTRLVDAYIAGDFATCEANCDALEPLVGPGDKLIALYRRMCDHCRAQSPDTAFHGEIVLAEK